MQCLKDAADCFQSPEVVVFGVFLAIVFSVKDIINSLKNSLLLTIL